MPKIVFQVTVPDELVQPLLQAVRDFDMCHDPQHEGKVQFELLTENDWPVEKMARVMNAVTPRPQFMYTANCLCIPGCDVNFKCPIHGDKAVRP